MCADLDATRSWVSDILGPLAIDDEPYARLRETLRVFLASECSYLAAAEQKPARLPPTTAWHKGLDQASARTSWDRDAAMVFVACRSPVNNGHAHIDPAGFDFTFVYWYLVRFTGDSPFSHSALDIKTYAMAMLKTGYRDTTKRAMPRRWFDNGPHTHVALDDAIGQGALFCNMLAENLGP